MTVKVLDKECCTGRPGLDAKFTPAMMRGALKQDDRHRHAHPGKTGLAKDKFAQGASRRASNPVAASKTGLPAELFTVTS